MTSALQHDRDCEVASNRLVLGTVAALEDSTGSSSATPPPSSDTTKHQRRARSTTCRVSFSLLFVLILGGFVLVAFVHRQSEQDYETPGVAAYEQRNITIMEKSEGTSPFPVIPIAPTCINDQSAPRDTMVARIQAGQFVCSPSMRYRFGLLPGTHGPAELVVVDHDRDDSIVWTSGILHTNDESSMDSLPTSLSLDLKPDGALLLVDDETNEVVRVVVEGKSRTMDHTNDEDDGGSTTLRVDDLGVASIYDTHKGHTWSTASATRSIDGSSAALVVETVDTSTLEGKVMAGYQGWFGAQGDGGFEEWAHWSDPRNILPNGNTLTIDMWPDLRELEPDELYETDLFFDNGARASLFSSSNTKTVERHVKWMSDYGLDGVFVQRFVREVAVGRGDRIDQVLASVRSGCEKYGRTFVVMYDIVGIVPSLVVETIMEDWRHLVDNVRITESPSYLRHRGRPLLAIWGIGFLDIPTGLEEINLLLDFFKNESDVNTLPRYQATIMGGVPTTWRNLDRESDSPTEWLQTFRRLDVVSPWTVARYNSPFLADLYKQLFILPDLEETQAMGIDYLPVVYPGFAQFNLAHSPYNQIPRLGGAFFWRQLFNALSTNNNMVYVAMFDEVDEATSIFKVADRQAAIPHASLLSLNDDGGCVEHVPSDWYLQLSGEAARFAKDSDIIPSTMPRPGTISGFPLQIARTPIPLPVTCLDRGPEAEFELVRNQYICSSSGAYALGFNEEGNFGVWNILNGRTIWQAGTQGDGVRRMVFQLDGNLVVFGPSNQVLFSTSTSVSEGDVVSSLTVSNRGRVTITQTGRGIAWTSWCIDDGPEAIVELGILEAVCSPDHQYRFGVTSGGDLGLFRMANDQILWNTNTNGGPTTRMVLQQDGNLTLFGAGGSVLFTTSTMVDSNLDVPSLVVDDGGVASVIHSTRGVVWTTTPCSSQGPVAPFDLGRNNYRCSSNGKYRFGMTNTGELSMFNNLSGQRIWDAGIQNGLFMRLQSNGNLVVFGEGDAVLFTTSTTRLLFFQFTRLSISNRGVATLVRDGLRVVWASGCTNQTPDVPVSLQVGEYVCSPSRNYVFGLTDEGRLTSFNSRSNAVRWDPGILADLGSRLFLQPDGNLVVLDSKDFVLFATNTGTSDPHSTRLSVTNFGNVNLERDGQFLAVWSSTFAACG